MAKRLNQHNSGYGAEDTAPVQYRPWFVACYLTNMAHLDVSGRMSLEKKWQDLNNWSGQRGRVNIETWINNGRTVMDEFNRMTDEENHIRMVVTVRRRPTAEQQNGT